MSEQVINPFLVNDTDESLKSKTGGVFGLNAGVNIVEISYSDKAKDGSESHSVVLSLQVGERQYKRYLFFNPGEKVFVKNVLSGPEVEGYAEVYMANLVQKIAVIKHTLKAVGVSAEQIDNVARTLNPNDIINGVKAFLTLVPADFKTRKVDAFLEYQYSIRKDNDETYLEYPENMKGGIFLCPSVTPTGTWNEVITEDGSLTYVDNAGGVHPFTRNSAYMESNRAKRQTKEDQKKSGSNGFNASAGNPQQATRSTWGSNQ